MKECTRCLFTSEIAAILPDGTCNYCQLHDQLEAQANPEHLRPAVDRIKRKGKGKQYDCLIGISGGLDSSVLLYWAVRYSQLRPLVIHFDNGWNAPESENNMRELINKLGVNSITYRVDKEEYDRLNDAFLWAGTPDADIPNDIAMTKLMYDTAHKYGINWILNGHDFRTEGSTPAKWTYMDARYIQDVYRKYSGTGLRNYPLFTFMDQLFYAWKGIKQIRPFHYGIDREQIEAQMKREINWQDYGGKHCENVYTEFVGAYLLPVKFGIDKRIVYLSAQVRSGKLCRTSAEMKMMTPPVFDLKKIPSPILGRTKTPIRDRKEFDRYNFRRYRLLIWLLAKMKVVPQTFYVKYAK